MAISKRHHFIGQSYLRNFGDPIFSDSIFCYVRKTKKWEHRTPNGIGWAKHLFSMINDDGQKTDGFESWMSQYVESPAAPAFKKAAESPETLSLDERAAISFFIGITAARNPSMMATTQQQYLSNLSDDRASELEERTRQWCEIAGRNYDERSRIEFLKPSVFGSIVIWAMSLRERLLSWNWTFIRTDAENPFVTSDSPVFSERESMDGIHLLGFPISSEVALIANSEGQIRSDTTSLESVRAVNMQTLARASEFVVCRKPSFPADNCLPAWPFLTA